MLNISFVLISVIPRVTFVSSVSKLDNVYCFQVNVKLSVENDATRLPPFQVVVSLILLELTVALCFEGKKQSDPGLILSLLLRG